MAKQKLFIVHGWTYTLDKWQPLLKLLDESGLEPVMLKVPGLAEPSDQVWDIEGYVDWLDKQLDKEKQPILLGHSNGGRIALALCQRQPERLRHLILIGSAGVPHTNQRTTIKRRAAGMLVKLGKPLKAVPLVSKVFYRLIGASDYHNAPPNMKRTMQNMLNADTGLDLGRVTVPTTLIWGRRDNYTPLRDGHLMQATLPQANLFVIDGAGHSPHYTHTEQVRDIIIGAVEGVA